MLGEGEIAPNKVFAATLFKQGAELGNAWCQFLYARTLWYGEGVVVDQAEATTLMQQAAAAGDKEAFPFCQQNNIPLP